MELILKHYIMESTRFMSLFTKELAQIMDMFVFIKAVPSKHRRHSKDMMLEFQLLYFKRH